MQFIDSAFPTGALSHSGGIESALQVGLVRDGSGLRSVLEAALDQASHSMLPFVDAGYAAMKLSTVGSVDDACETAPFADAFSASDAACDLVINNSIANQASRSQGRATLASAVRIFVASDGASEHGSTDFSESFPARRPLAVIAQLARGGRTACHLAPIFGAVVQTLGAGREEARRLFLFVSLRAWISAAVRLGVVGPLEGQSIQASLSGLVQSLAAADPVDPGDAAQTSPILDLLQGVQDRLYSRLFQS